MSQQTNAGFNAPGFSIGSDGAHTVRPSKPLISTFGVKLPSLWPLLVGVGHMATTWSCKFT